MTTEDYLLGHDDDELARLEEQARILAPATRTILERAGVGPGMRVLDLGTGVGDVAFEVADLVGPSGSVVGVDKSPIALASARRRALDRGADVVFVEGDLADVEIAGSFDAVVGRLVLLYAPDPGQIVKRFAQLVRPGGVVVAMEYEMTAAGSLPRHPFTDQLVSWIVGAFEGAGLDPLLGARLGDVLTAAGLPSPSSIGLQSYLAPDDPSGGRMVAGVIRTLLPAIVASGLASEDDVDIDTLADRVNEFHMSSRSVFKPPALVGCWASVE